METTIVGDTGVIQGLDNGYVGVIFYAVLTISLP